MKAGRDATLLRMATARAPGVQIALACGLLAAVLGSWALLALARFERRSHAQPDEIAEHARTAGAV